MKLRKTILTSIFLALAIILPFFTGQLPVVGRSLLPMHVPVLICGLICGWRYGLVLGLSAPLLRSVMFGMPPLIPVGLPMAFELAVYGMISGSFFSVLKEKHGFNYRSVYISLLVAMLAGRIMWGTVRFMISQTLGIPFSWQLFVTGAVTTAIPGIIIQLILIPVLIISLKKDIIELETM